VASSLRLFYVNNPIEGNRMKNELSKSEAERIALETFIKDAPDDYPKDNLEVYSGMGKDPPTMERGAVPSRSGSGPRRARAFIYASTFSFHPGKFLRASIISTKSERRSKLRRIINVRLMRSEPHVSQILRMS
jgi:hypothetical protein